MHVINSDNYAEAEDAIRDILMLYVGLADDTAGFGHAADVYVRFDPLKFVDAEQDAQHHYVNLDLLRCGSAIAIVCTFYDLWNEEQHLAEHPLSKRYETALGEGRLQAFADIEAVLREAIRRDYLAIDDDWFEQAVAPIYRKYVLGFFRRLAGSNRSVS